MTMVDSLDRLWLNPHPSWLCIWLKRRSRRCKTTGNAMAGHGFLSNGKDTPIATTVENHWNFSRMEWIMFRAGWLTTCRETSFLSKQVSLLCPINGQYLLGPNSRKRNQLITAFLRLVLKASMTTMYLRTVVVLQVGFRFSLIFKNSCFVSRV